MSELSATVLAALCAECGGAGVFDDFLARASQAQSAVGSKRRRVESSAPTTGSPALVSPPSPLPLVPPAKRRRRARRSAASSAAVPLDPRVQVLLTSFDAGDTQFARDRVAHKPIEAKIKLMYGALVLLKALMQTTPALVQPALMAKLVELAKMQRVLRETYPEMAAEAAARPPVPIECPRGVEQEEVEQALETISGIARAHTAALRRAAQHHVL